MHDHYPAGTVRALLPTNQVTDATRQALTQRLNAPLRQPTFFTANEFALLQAVCARLIPQNDRLKTDPIDIAGSIDERLAEGTSNGWRYDAMPTDGDAYRLGLVGIDESAVGLYERPFQQLPDNQQDEVLKAIQAMDPPGASGSGYPSGASLRNYWPKPSKFITVTPWRRKKLATSVWLTYRPGNALV